MIESKEITNPFPGLRPFEIDEYRLFFGREGQSDELIARLRRSHFLTVVGTSGSGKSSLVRAGLLPALRGGMMAGAGSGWRIAIMRPGSDPIGNLAAALAEKDVLAEAGGGLAPAEAQAVIEATLRRGSLGLVDVVRGARLKEHEKVLVVVDQFEELFRFRGARAATSTEDDASAFVKLLLEAAQQRELSIYVVPTMRSDFLGDCAQFQGLPEAINDGQYLIPRMSRDERRFAITGPIGFKRRKITEPLVSRLMNDVGDNPDQLPILQHALMRTWDYWSAHRLNGEPLGLEHYEAIGAMSDALSLHADEAFNELPDERSRLIAEKLFKALTERGADNREIRRPTSLGAICEIAGADLSEVVTVIEVFRGGGRSFLMPPAGVALQPETVIDISHESLIRNWRRLQVWVNEEAQSARIYRRLAEAAVLHREGKEGLAIDPALQIALDWRVTSKPTAAWAKRYHPEFDESIAYLETSRAARDEALAESERRRNEELERERREREQAEVYAEEQRRSAQRLRRFTFALILISLFALAAAGASVYAFGKAKLSETRAQNLAGRLADSLKEVTAAKEEANSQRDVARVAQLKAEGERKHAEDARKLADDAARLADQHATDERRAKEKLGETLRHSKALTDAGRSFRIALADYDRWSSRNSYLANGSWNLDKAYAGVKDAVVNFERLGDYDGVAAAYIKLGVIAPHISQAMENEKTPNWEKAVYYYNKSGNYNEAGETLESLGDSVAQNKVIFIEFNPDAILGVDEQDRVAAAARFEGAYREFERAKAEKGMISSSLKAALVYGSLGGEANSRKAIEWYERSLGLQKIANEGTGWPDHIESELLRLYYETEQPARAAPIIDEHLKRRRDDGWKGEAQVFQGVAWSLLPHPAAFEFFERARQLYRREHDTGGELSALLMTAGQIKEKEQWKIKWNEKARDEWKKPLSDANYRRGLEYYEAVLATAPARSDDPRVTTQAQVLRPMAELHQVEGRLAEAVAAYERVLALSKGVRDDVYISKLYQTLGKLQEDAGQLRQALETYKQYLALLDATTEDLEPGEREGVVDKIESLSKKLGIEPPNTLPPPKKAP